MARKDIRDANLRDKDGNPVPFVVNDSGARQEFDSGMVRDTQEGKTNYTRIFDGVMADRWAEHMTKGEAKYPDVRPGVPNWTLAKSPEEVQRFRISATRHFVAWLHGETDEDHAAGVYFNIDGAETTQKKINGEWDAIPFIEDVEAEFREAEKDLQRIRKTSEADEGCQCGKPHRRG